MRTDAPCETTPLTGCLPAMSPGGARAARLGLDPRFGRLLDADGQGWQVAALEVAPQATVHRVRIQADAGSIELLASAADHPALSMLAGPATDAGLSAYAARVLLEPWLERLENLGIGVQSVAVDTPAASSAVAAAPWCVARNGVGTALNLGLLHCAEGVLDAVRRQFRNVPMPRGLRGLAVRGTVTLGTRPVNIDTLRGLGRGDVLIAPWCAPIAGRRVEVQWGLDGHRSLHATACLDETTLTLQGASHMSDLETAHPESVDEDNIDALAELDIPVHFELETVAMPLADLAALNPGMVIELASPVAAAGLRLTACGQTIGHAELVAVGEHLGARITRMVTR